VELAGRFALSNRIASLAMKSAASLLVYLVLGFLLAVLVQSLAVWLFG
jgi:hypothetical protein